MIGGVGTIVEIDESKYGKRKYNKGKRVKGNWVFGGIERKYDETTRKFSTGKCFMVVVEKRNRPILRDEMLKFIRPGTLVRSDCWGAYENMESWGNNWAHEEVNHSECFVTEEGIHTNTIEGQWRISKDDIPNRVYQDSEELQEHLYYQMWKKGPVKDGTLFDSVLKALGEVVYLNTDEEGYQSFLRKNCQDGKATMKVDGTEKTYSVPGIYTF